MFRKKVKASFTIEASLIVPVLLFIIAAMITVGFMLHDRIIMNAVTAYEVIDHAGDFSSAAEEAAGNVLAELDRRLITAGNLNVTGKEDSGTIKMQASGEARIPLPSVEKLIGEGSGKLSASINVSNLNGRKALIKYKTMIDGLSFFKNNSGEKENE